MIDYKLFQFAAPPLTGDRQFVASWVGSPLNDTDSHDPFTPFPESKDHPLRITMIRHPVDWLFHLHYSIDAVPMLKDSILGTLDRDTPASFVESYTRIAPGFYTALCEQYEADSVIRCEDLPMAVQELADSIGVQLWRPCDPIPSCVPYYFDPRLRHAVMDAEMKLADRYDYW